MQILRRRFGLRFAKVAYLVLLLLGATSIPGMAVTAPNDTMDTAFSTRYDYLGHQLMCTCGCNSVLLECNHLNCGPRDQMRKELSAAISGGSTDDQILASFVQKYGSVVLAAPTHKGFNRVAWIMPYLALLLGLAGVGLLVRLWKRRRAAKPAFDASTIAAPQFNKYCRRIQEETEL